MNLNLGAWTHRIPGYLSVDADPNVAPDVLAAVPPVPAEDGSAKHLYAGHFLEHLAPWDVLPFLADCHRALVVGGTLTLVVPDMRRVRLLANSQMLIGAATARLLLGDDAHAGMEHWTLWDRARLEDALRRAGFTVDPEYDWRTDERLYDRTASWQGGARGIK